MSHRIPILSIPTRNFANVLTGLRRDAAAPLRKLTLKAAPPGPFAARPTYAPLSTPDAGKSIVSGRLSCAAQTIDIGIAGHPWTRPLPSQHFATRIHSFDWLHNLAVLGETKAGPRSRQLYDDWAEIYGEWNVFAWAPDVLSHRLFAVLACWGAVLSGDTDTAPMKIAARRTVTARQVLRLKSVWKQTTPGLPRLRALGTLALGGAMLSDTDMLDKNLDRLDDELELQVLGDGGHISRRPEAGLQVLQILLVLEDALKIRGIAGSKQTRRAIDRLAPTFAFFNPGDGGLASFNGSGDVPAKVISNIVKKAGIRNSKPFGYMPHSGYQRLERSGTIIIMDTGDSPPRPFDQSAHLSPLAFELSTAFGKMVVNCGINSDQPEGWKQVARETAAHSTLIIDDCSCGSLVTSSRTLKAFGTAISKSSGPVYSSRKEQDSDIWLEANHEGYRSTTGLDHRRRIYLAGNGDDIRAEDSLYVPIGSAPLFKGSRFPFKIRFHLHPNVRVTLARDEKSALIILPGGEGWRFRTDTLPLTLEKSIYLAKGNRPLRCEQLVISGDALSNNNGQDISNCVRWNFKKVPKDPTS